MLSREDERIMRTALKYYRMNLITESDMRSILAIEYSKSVRKMVYKSIKDIILPFTDRVYKDILKNHAN